MRKHNLSCMQQLSIKVETLVFVAVSFISYYRMSKVLSMHSYLMSTASFQLKLHQRIWFISLQYGVVSCCTTSVFVNVHFFAVDFASTDWQINNTTILLDYPFDQSNVNSSARFALYLACKALGPWAWSILLFKLRKRYRRLPSRYWIYRSGNRQIWWWWLLSFLFRGRTS